MHLFLLGVSHRTAPVDLRERLDFSSRNLGEAIDALAMRPSAAESVVVSTCNRSEIYVASDDPAKAREELVAFLSEYHQLPPETFLPHLFVKEDGAAAGHLFRVAAGLDSLVVGEPQILGQVKDAFQTAAERRAAGPLLSKLFHWSFNVGKRVRTETALGEGAVSISFAAVALARKIFGQLQGRRVLVVGASGAVGSALVQLALHSGAEVTAVASTPNLGLVTSLGAHHAIDYTTTDVTAGPAEYDIIADTVGATPFSRYRRILRPGGRLLAIAAGLPDMLAALWAPLYGRRVIVGPASEALDDLRQIASLAEQGALRPVIDRHYDMSDIAAAHAYVATGRKRGSVVVRIERGDCDNPPR